MARGSAFRAPLHRRFGGTPAETMGGMDRRSWVGMATPSGEFRMGRQNTEIFYRGGCIDFTARIAVAAQRG